MPRPRKRHHVSSALGILAVPRLAGGPHCQVITISGHAEGAGGSLLQKLPLTGDQILLARVIDTLTNVIEHPESVAERPERVAAVIGDARRVTASTDCGAKLASLPEGARIASRRLFR